MASCKKCEAPIVWGTTSAGKAMPLDADPVPDGEWVLVAGKVRRFQTDDERLHRPRYRVHWKTCPNADEFRRGR